VLTYFKYRGGKNDTFLTFNAQKEIKAVIAEITAFV
jgi:hypothetical protein